MSNLTTTDLRWIGVVLICIGLGFLWSAWKDFADGEDAREELRNMRDRHYD